MNNSEFTSIISKKTENLDSKKLEELYGILQNFLNSSIEIKDWSGLTVNEIEGIEAAIDEMNEGKGIPSSVIMAKMKAKINYA